MTQLSPMQPLDPENGVVARRRVTTINRRPETRNPLTNDVPSAEGSLREQLASYERWARNHKSGFVFGREAFLLRIIGELADRLEQIEGKV